MNDPVLARLGARRALEGGVELFAPLGFAALGWGLSLAWLNGPTVAVGATQMELAAVFGANAAITGYAGGRLAWMLRWRGPRQAVGLAWALLFMMLLLTPKLSADQVSARCAEQGGVMIRDALNETLGGGRPLCQLNAVAGNPYLPGRLVRPRWAGALTGWAWPPLLILAGLAALGWRDRRLVPTGIGEQVLRALPYAPGAGWAASPRGGPDPSGRVEACANVTWWGELCGQVYPGDRAPKPGEACARCHQGFRRAERRLALTIVSLSTADVDTLNAWEGVGRADEAAGLREDRGGSSASRWVVLGELELPDVLTVAQALALVHARLPEWAKATADAKAGPTRASAAALAQDRASRISAWLWAGVKEKRLTCARPEREAVLALGPQRLRDLPPRRGEPLWLQLDLGLLPLELWEGRRDNKSGTISGHHRALWIPVAAPRRPSSTPGLWVPRVEGDALRAWLSTARLSDQKGELAAFPIPLPDAKPTARGGGPLDLVLRPIDPKTRAPSATPQPGESITEWLWLERAQIQALRRNALVMVEK